MAKKSKSQPPKPNRKRKTKKSGKAKPKSKKKQAKRRKSRKASNRSTRPAFEQRKRQPKVSDEQYAPPGFDIKLGNVTQDEAYATIQARLDDARERLPEGYQGRVILHPYADGSVDGELYVRVDEEVDTRDAEFDLYDAFTSISVGRHYWISVGGRYQIDTDDAAYRRNKGMTQVATNYQRATPTNIVETHLLMRHTIIAGMDKKFGVGARDLFIRLHWNPDDVQPKR